MTATCFENVSIICRFIDLLKIHVHNLDMKITCSAVYGKVSY